MLRTSLSLHEAFQRRPALAGVAFVALVTLASCSCAPSTSDEQERVNRDPASASAPAPAITSSPPNLQASIPNADSSPASTASTATGEAVSLTGATPFESAFGYDPMTGQLGSRQYETLISECMAAAGFDYFPFEANDVQLGTARSQALQQPDPETWYLITLPFRRLEGFEPTSASAQRVDPNEALVNGLADAERAAYFQAFVGSPDGVPPNDGGGCVDDAALTLWGDRSGESPLVTSATEEVIAAALASISFQHVRQRWSQCMAAAGVDARDRKSLIDDIRRSYGAVYDSVATSNEVGPTALAIIERERVAASRDVDCDRETGYTVAWFAEVSAEQDLFLEQNPGFIAAFEESRQT